MLTLFARRNRGQEKPGTDPNKNKTITYSFNDAGSLTGYNDGTTSATYTYDDLQRRIGETVN